MFALIKVIPRLTTTSKKKMLATLDKNTLQSGNKAVALGMENVRKYSIGMWSDVTHFKLMIPIQRR